MSLSVLLARPQALEGNRPLFGDVPTSAPAGSPDAGRSLTVLWRALLVRAAPLPQTGIATAATNAPLLSAREDAEPKRRGRRHANAPLLSAREDAEPKRRGRRHANSGLRGHHPHHGHPQLMRVGCVLGTCQVQNLSHRLYQLIGQTGRDDSSPVNPRSPHSYG
ncbi:protein ADM2a isoform X2 [Alosa pseudoharengus]|uniref:protein ADM2a isoform X2 n=1 Tax=Alosa pseudoharengus TaxID=34774 RepID=UPI003F8981D2